MQLIYNNKTYKVRYCNNFFTRLKGLMFYRKLKDNEVFLFKLDKEYKLRASIHMLFVFFPINVIWLNSKYEIVDVKKAHPFTSFIMPNKKARYILESNLNNNFKIGDKVTIH